ncbi:MAG: NAD(P)-dependent alcohol dehydrogenase [Anaerolineae bacterium]|nr:NAD(P)-dependent alcohol dehydrogenase [Anaerolineae bacterium]
MKAIVWTTYGPADGLHLKELPKPSPKDNEVLIKIHAASVTAGDCEVRTLKLPFMLGIPLRLWFGIRNPGEKILGQELAGEIEAVGKDVKRFKVGDAIFGTPGFSFGAYAEYKCLAETAVIAIKLANMTYEEAAGITIGGQEALHFMRQADIQPGQKVLINAAGGSIGTFALQLAKYFGAEVTAVDRTEKLDTMRSIGADHVIDYMREDFTKGGETYDIIYDVIGKSSFAGCIKSLKPNGRYLLGNAGLPQMLQGRWASMTSDKKVIMGTANLNVKDLDFLKGLVEQGKIKTVIDRSYPLEQVADAHRYVESGQKKGNVIITV